MILDIELIQTIKHCVFFDAANDACDIYWSQQEVAIMHEIT